MEQVIVDLVECLSCEFVFRAGSTSTPIPKGRDACPNCGGSDFQFLER